MRIEPQRLERVIREVGTGTEDFAQDRVPHEYSER